MYPRGFSLIELLIVICIIAILASLAYPKYLNYKIRVNRADVQAEMQNIAVSLQQYKIMHQNYNDLSLGRLGIATFYPRTDSPFFELRLTVTPLNWTLAAIPKAGSMQQDDGAIVLNSLGQSCWIEGQICIPNAYTNWVKP